MEGVAALEGAASEAAAVSEVAASVVGAAALEVAVEVAAAKVHEEIGRSNRLMRVAMLCRSLSIGVTALRDNVSLKGLRVCTRTQASTRDAVG
jgi:hypothetical protein